MFNKTILVIAVASLGSGFAGQALAGAAAGANQSVNMRVQQDGGDWNLNLTGLMTFNAATGDLSLDASKVTAPVSDALGQWSLASAGSLDISGAVLTADRVRWHSWVRADGTAGSAATTSNPWASVFTFTASGNVDPFMTYGFTVKNNTASTQTYTFTMGEALVPAVAGAYDIHADVSGAIVNGTGATVSITPALADQDGDSIAELQVLRLSNDNGLTFVNAGVDVGQADASLTSKAYGLYSQDKSSAGSFNYWALETKFTLTPGKDVASLAGYVEISPVPEPEQSGMLVAGLGMIGWMVRRRLSSR